ncbi:MAG: TRAP transporter large permease subunit [Spirochaetia bacterium]|jgi:C4-dicarboxylate transporter DctM subunit|nr:TRAP transporter large permease subunit [Spirochaetia bacterium]
MQIKKYTIKVEDTVTSVLLLLLAILPFVEILLRTFFKSGLVGGSEYTAHLVLWITFLGGMITSRNNQHLAISAGLNLLGKRTVTVIDLFNRTISTAITFAFAISGFSMILLAFDKAMMIGVFPVRLLTSIIPLGYLFISIRFSTSSKTSASGKWLIRSGFLFGIILAIPSIINILYTLLPEVPVFMDEINDIYFNIAGILFKPFLVILILSTFFGVPLFVILGGVAYILFAGNWGVLELIPNEAYSMLTGNTIAAIPMFTLAGFILSESKAGERLIGLFQALFGWVPGGMAVAAVFVCAFFTTFTGASGVTILALGALLAFILEGRGGYRKDFSHGLLTASGSIGLLFPPSLPIILYGVIAQISIKDLFIGGIIPGFLMVIALSGFGIVVAVKSKIPRTKFKFSLVFSSLKEAVWEIFLPFIILLSYFGGITTIVETGAVAVIYVLFVEVIIQKDIKYRDIVSVFLKSIPIIGGILIILASSRGLSYFIIDAEIPMKLTSWVEINISSKYVFLILLNIALLLTGSLMDIFSAIMVIVPLMLPLGAVFGIDPVHLGIIFLANLELGYLTPPVGLNLFLASYRFEEPLLIIYKTVIPFFLMLLFIVLLITYVPWLSTGLLK